MPRNERSAMRSRSGWGRWWIWREVAWTWVDLARNGILHGGGSDEREESYQNATSVIKTRHRLSKRVLRCFQWNRRQRGEGLLRNELGAWTKDEVVAGVPSNAEAQRTQRNAELVNYSSVFHFKAFVGLLSARHCLLCVSALKENTLMQLHRPGHLAPLRSACHLNPFHRKQRGTILCIKMH